MLLFFFFFKNAKEKRFFFFFTSLSCKHTLKLSFAQHARLLRLSSAVGWWVRIMSVLVCGRPGDSQSKGHLPQQSFWLKTCTWLSTLTHFWSLNFRWFPSPARGMKTHTGKLHISAVLSLTAMRLHWERKSSSQKRSQICSVLSISDQRPQCELKHFSLNHSGLLKTARFKIDFHWENNQHKSVNCEPSSV